jgi:hypothetical protein
LTNKQNASPNVNIQKKPEADSDEKPKPKKKKQWECPSIRAIEKDVFEALGRQDKGRLKYEQLVTAINQVKLLL